MGKVKSLRIAGTTGGGVGGRKTWAIREGRVGRGRPRIIRA